MPVDQAVGLETQYELKEFNLLTSVNLLEQDLIRYGDFQLPTIERVTHEEKTHVVEGINARFITRFTYQYENGRVLAVDGTPLLQMAMNGQKTAEHDAAVDPRLAFHHQRANHDFNEAVRIEEMMAGQTGADTIISFSLFPEEANRMHGATLLENKGYNPERGLSFIRIFHKTSANTLQAITISLDNSDPSVFRTLAAKFGVNIPEAETTDNFLAYRIETNMSESRFENLPEELREIYDHELSYKLNQDMYFGRPRSESKIDAMMFVEANADLLNHHLRVLKGLALRRQGHSDMYLEDFISRSGSGGDELAIKRHSLYGTWAAMKDRLERGLTAKDISDGYGYDIAQEIVEAGMQAAANMERMIGCGGAIDITLLDEETAKSLIFGEDAAEKKKWTYVSGVCSQPFTDKDGCPLKGKNTLIGPCSKMCLACEKCY